MGGTIDRDYTSSQIYERERGSSVYGLNDVSTVSAGLSETPIGLMYLSDYGYGAPSSCIMNLADYSNLNCSSKDWLKSNGQEWIIAHDTDNPNILVVISDSGYAYGPSAISGRSVRPTLYLKSNVYYVSGVGTQVDPYIISFD